MRIARFVVVLVLTAGLVVLSSFAGSTLAQQKGKGKFGQGFGGFGGINVTDAVLSNKALQDELKVTAEQKEKMKPVADKLAAIQKKQADAFGGGKGKGNFGKGGGETFKELQAVREEAKKAVDETLTADQKKRFKQIEVQARGVRAFTNEETSKELNLTETQKTKIKEISDAFQKESGEARRELFGGGAVDAEKRAEVDKKVDKLQMTAMTQIQEALTNEQKKTWKTMVGEPFDVSKLRTPVRRID